MTAKRPQKTPKFGKAVVEKLGYVGGRFVIFKWNHKRGKPALNKGKRMSAGLEPRLTHAKSFSPLSKTLILVLASSA